MAYSPGAHDTLYIDGVLYSIAEHPSAPGIPYGQEGRAAIVYRLVSDETHETRAFKVFKPRFQIPALVGLSERLEAFSTMPGLQVCHRQVITARRNIELVRQHPGLSYAVLMPWIEGPTWMEVLLEGRPISPEQSLMLARSLTEIFAGMEERGVAHCDLSGPNVLLPVLADENTSSSVVRRSSSNIELVDVEQMFGEDLKRPEFVPAGSSGYAHKTAADGLWNARADRFAGALLISELLCWCDPSIREASWGESYFDPEEMQQPTERYRLLYSTLKNLWGESAAQLLEQSWESDSLADCATFGQWIAAIPDHVPTSAVQVHTAESEKVQPIVTPQASTNGAAAASETPVSPKTHETGGLPPYIREMLDEARRFEDSGNLGNAVSTYREVLSMAPAGSGLVTEIPLIISQLEAKQQPVATESAQATQGQLPMQTATAVQTPVTPAPLPVPIPVPAPTPQPAAPQVERKAASQPKRDEVFLPAQQARAQQSMQPESPAAGGFPIIPIAAVAIVAILVIVAVFLLIPKSQAVVTDATPTVVANATAAPTTAATIGALDPTTVPTVASSGGELTLVNIATLKDNRDIVSGVAFSSDSQSIASSSHDGKMRVWQTSDGKLLRTYGTGDGPVYSLAISPEGQQFASGLAGGSVLIWGPEVGQLLKTIGMSEFSVSSLAYSPDGKIIAIARNNGEITLVNADDGTELHLLKGTRALVHSLAFSPDGATLYTASQENKVQAWRVADGTPRESPFSSITDSMALSVDGQTLAIGLTGAVEIWDVPNGQKTRTIEGITGDVKSLAFSPNGQVLAAATDRVVTFFRVSDGSQLVTLQDHTARVNSIAISPDGQFFASGSDDWTVSLWKLSLVQSGASLPGSNRETVSLYEAPGLSGQQ